MNREQQILPILYEMALVIGGETSVKPLLMKTLQRLLYHTSFPAGLVFLDLPPDTGAASIEGRFDAVVGDYALGACIGRTVSLPTELLRGGAELREDAALLEALSGPANPYSVFLRLPIDRCGVILLLAPVVPHTELPLARIFQPVMANLAKAILLCRNNEAYTNGILAERDVARETLRKVRQVELALRESESRLRAIMDSVQAGIVIIDPDTHKIVDVNFVTISMIGIAKEALIGSVCHKFIYPPEPGKGTCPIIDLNQTADRSECVLLTATGERRPIIRSVTTVLLGGKEHLLASYIDITELKRVEAQLNASLAEKEVLVQSLSELAIRDGLTGLYNHRAFYKFLEDELARAQRFKRPLSLLLLDIDHFKRVNDTHGHLAGDAVLRGLSELLGREARAIDRVCRYGGEEITVILPETDLDAATHFAERLRAAVEAQPFDADTDAPLHITVSIGVASWPAQADNAQALIAAADTAMYAAKQGGRNRVVRYAPALAQPATPG